jgi:hypothetical protein
LGAWIRLLGFGKGIALCNFIAPAILRWRRSAVRRQSVFLINENRFFARRCVSIVAHQNPELQRRFVMNTALEDAVLPREIVALTTLPQSGFVQQPITLLISKQPPTPGTHVTIPTACETTDRV